jgi:hypothetical protein
MSESAGEKIFVGVTIAVVSAVILAWLGLREKSTTPVVTSPPIALTQPTPSNVSGTYRGSVFNKTVGQSGSLRIVLNQDASGKITGTVNVTGHLIGSGLLEGYTDGKKVGFTSVEQSTGMLITWEGAIQDRAIAGDYSVSVPAWQKFRGSIDQEGVWRVSK